jgi:hypothetical protein
MLITGNSPKRTQEICDLAEPGSALRDGNLLGSSTYNIAAVLGLTVVVAILPARAGS